MEKIIQGTVWWSEQVTHDPPDRRPVTGSHAGAGQHAQKLGSCTWGGFAGAEEGLSQLRTFSQDGFAGGLGAGA